MAELATADLWGHWDAPWPADVAVCIWCEDRPSEGVLILVRVRGHTEVPRHREHDRKPPLCEFCASAVHEHEAPDGPQQEKRVWMFHPYTAG